MARYADRYLNALMSSHLMTVRAVLTPVTGTAVEVPIVSGSVSADRSATVRRTAQLTIDPRLAPTSKLDKLTPYGSILQIWRGIRYPNGEIEEYPVFTGRLESVDDSIDGVSIRCSDRSADIVDAKFPSPAAGGATYNQLCRDEAKRFIQQVIPTATVLIETASTATVTRLMTVERERSELLDKLCVAMGAEWYADFSGVFHIKDLPAVITSATKPVWIVDSGDLGVTVDRTTTMDRTGVYNQVIVDGEAVGGPIGAHGEYHVPGVGDPGYDPDEPMRFGGPFGKVPGFYSGQAVNSTAAADALAMTYCLNSIAKTRSVTVTCIPNSKLGLGDVVRVYGLSAGIDGMYFVNSIDMPLTPDDAMTLVLHESIETDTPGLSVAELRIPEGAQWP